MTMISSIEAQANSKVWQAQDGWHIDVRGLKPPAPMLAILGLLENPDAGSRVVVHHDREPVFLYPELTERGWNWRLVPGDDREVRLVLSREAPF
ncbi:MAG: DUF2249 domain-containing protein [Alphaproteobacteria bacterium]|jgi:hypothetical protein|nr:DUF2249 domain-containing protein [Alphaproteobacteria bacterium]